MEARLDEGGNVYWTCSEILGARFASLGQPKSFIVQKLGFATPSDVAGAISTLLSYNAAFVSGSVLEIGGRMTAGYLASKHGED